MRSAWVPTRSMSLDTVLVVSPNCLLALPTVFAIDLTSSSGALSERGSGTPSTFLRRVRDRMSSPPATPAAVAPTATAGPFALPATLLTVPSIPSWLLLRLCVLRFALEPLERFEPLLERADALRDDPLRDDRAVAPDELVRALLFAAELLDAELLDADLLDPEPVDDPVLRCLLPEARLDALLAANAPSLFARGHC